jgi:hypothetical protein
MRRKLVVGLIVLNGMLAGALVTTPAKTQIIPLGLFNCCKTGEVESLGAYCCFHCCWFTFNCFDHDDCEADPPT